MKKFFTQIMFLLLVCSMTAFINGCKKEKSEPEEPTPVASFTASKTNVKTGESIYFSNNSTNASRYEWSFGDGNSSTASSPNHSYINAGTYTVKLTAYSASGFKKNESTTTIYVTKPVGDCIFWMSEGDYYVDVTLNGLTNTIRYNCTSTPDCGDYRGANFNDLPVGTYNFYATDDNGSYWDYHITIYEDQCSTMKLNYSKAQSTDVKGNPIPKLIE